MFLCKSAGTGALRRILPGLAALLFLASCTQESSPAIEVADIFQAVDRHDFEALAQYQDQYEPPDGASALVDGILTSMLGADRNAVEKLSALLEQETGPAIRARALRSLSGVYVRLGRYGDAAGAMAEIREMDDSDGVTIDDQSFAFFAALAGVAPMEVAYGGASDVDVTRDKAGLLRMPMTVNGITDDAIIDTGAAFSTATVSMANRMGMRQLGAAVEVGGSTERTVVSGIAIADRVEVGRITFRNAPFIVIPDESMSFPERDYAVSSIIGLPLIRAMERIAWRIEDEGGSFRIERSQRGPGLDTANMITSGWQQVVLARVNDGAARFRFFLDTGAQTGDFYQNAAELAPALFDNAETVTRRRGGLGGVTEEQQLLSVPTYEITIGDATVNAGPTDVIPDDGSFRHGVLGQDIFAQFDRIEIDFKEMTFRAFGAEAD